MPSSDHQCADAQRITAHSTLLKELFPRDRLILTCQPRSRFLKASKFSPDLFPWKLHEVLPVCVAIVTIFFSSR